VAEALGVPVGTVDSRLSRAMAKLRDALQAEEPRSSTFSREVAS
jgi:DNA-directed RNA polymerase specialized sigma24 family protein